MGRSIAFAVIVLAAAAIGGSNSAAQVKDANRFIKLGTRLPPVAEGEGGRVEVAAGPEWCKDETFLVELTWLFGIGGTMPVVRLPAGPSACDWKFDSLPAGKYSATIQRMDNEEIVAVGAGELFPGGSALVRLEPADVELEGHVVVDDLLPDVARLVFQITGGSDIANKWNATIGADGAYRVRFGSVNPRASVCITLEAEGRDGSVRTTSLTKIRVDCRTFDPGLHRVDFDKIAVPPGVLAIDIAPRAGPPDTTYARVKIDAGPDEAAFGRRNGLRAQALASFGDHIITVTMNGSTEILGSASVTLTPDDRIKRVSLRLK